MYSGLFILSFFSMFCGLIICCVNDYRSQKVMTCIFIIVLLTTFFNIIWYCSNWFTGDGVTWAVIYTLTNNLTGAGIKDFIGPAIVVVLCTSVYLIVSYFFIYKFRLAFKFNGKCNILLFVLFCLSLLSSPLITQGVIYYITSHMKYDGGFYRYYVSSNESIENPKFNLVYIYGESLEHAYFDKSIFPGLANDFNNLDVSIVDFDNTTQYAGMDFTIGGIVSSQCGLPLYSSVTIGKAEVKDGFFSGSTCLGDILKKSGYDNYFFQGADLRFTDKIAFFKQHGFDHVYGLMESGLQNEFNVQNTWGLYDDITLSLAWNKFQELSKQGKRFSIFALTLDTHPPKGFMSPECTNKDYVFDGKSIAALNAVQCSQTMIASFIKNIIESPWGDNTIIVLTSDHLATANMSEAYDILQKHKRSNTFMMIKKGHGYVANNKKRSTLDNGATILETLGGKDSIGLGRSSISRSSLTETFRDFGKEINNWIPAISDRWNKAIANNSIFVDKKNSTIIVGGKKYNLPVLIYQSKDGYIALTDNYGDSPLRFNLYKADIGTMFYWIDRCFQHGNIWRKDLKLSQEWCQAQGVLGGDIAVSKLKDNSESSEIDIKVTRVNEERYKKDVELLKQPEKEIRYESNELFFNLDGLPKNVLSVNGLSRREAWGRWSDANVASKITIQYTERLPQKFKMLLTAKAWGKNINKPVDIRVGNNIQNVRLQSKSGTYELSFDDVDHDTIEIHVPYPQDSWVGSAVGIPTLDNTLRKIGIGLVSLRIVPES